MSYIIERPAGMPDWVEIGVKFWGSRDGVNWKGPFNLTGYGEYNIRQDNEYRDTKGNWWRYAKPYTPWTPKEGEWCAFWDDKAEYPTIRRFLDSSEKCYLSVSKHGFGRWACVARITNDDGSLIDIRCTVDELKAKTDWLGPEEN